MIQFHVLEPWEELSIRNGSAILTVADHLAHAARADGHQSFLVGSEGKVRDRQSALGLLRPRPALMRGQVALDLALKAFAGRPLVSRESILRTSVSPDLVFLHNRPWEARFFREAYPDAKIVLYVHNRVMRGPIPAAMRAALSGFDRIVCVSRFVADDLANRSRSRPELRQRIRVVRNSTPTISTSFAPDFDFDILFVGRLVKEKGAHVLLEAAAMSRSEWRIHIIGGHSFLPTEQKTRYQRKLMRQADAIRPRPVFSGPLPPDLVADARASAAVAVVPSVWDEPCGLVLLEAMSSPAAVVASAVGGMTEFGAAGGIAFTRRSNAAELALAIDALLDSDERRRRNANAGQREIADRSWGDAYGELMGHVN